MYIYIYIYIYILHIYINSKRGCGFESHPGQLSIWNRKTLAQNEYHTYIHTFPVLE